MMKRILTLALLLSFGLAVQAQIKALIVDGQNNHVVWPKSTIMMKKYLEETGLFEVDIYRSKYTWKAEREEEYLAKAGVGVTQDLPDPKADPDFAPKFKNYDVVISNFGWKAAPWPEKTKKAFEKFMKAGGGFVSVHAADNSFPEWPAYNEMIGLGGWGDRTEKDGPYVYFTNDGKLEIDNTPGKAGSHGPQNNIYVTIRDDHPITRGLPKNWYTAKDECYAKLRGPARNMTILATGKDMSGKAPTDRHEPTLMVIDYYKGRVFHTTLGHDDYSMEGVDFITTFLRGTEWAATAKVTIPVPEDFPKQDEQRSRKFELVE